MCVQIAGSYPNGEVARMPRSHGSLHAENVKERRHLGAQGRPKGWPQEPSPTIQE